MFKRSTLLLVFFVLIANLSHAQQRLKKWDEKNWEEKATFFMEVVQACATSQKLPKGLNEKCATLQAKLVSGNLLLTFGENTNPTDGLAAFIVDSQTGKKALLVPDAEMKKCHDLEGKEAIIETLQLMLALGHEGVHEEQYSSAMYDNQIFQINFQMEITLTEELANQMLAVELQAYDALCQWAFEVTALEQFGIPRATKLFGACTQSGGIDEIKIKQLIIEADPRMIQFLQ